jgi:hypothetical protein
MDITKLAINYFRANNPLLALVSEEIFPAQTAIEEAVTQINKLREAETDPRPPVRLVLHDPLAGFHFGTFNVTANLVEPRTSLQDLCRLIQPESLGDMTLADSVEGRPGTIKLKGQQRPIEETDDVIAVLKNWDMLFDPQRFTATADFIMAFINILQGNLCATQWQEVASVPRNTPAWATLKNGNRFSTIKRGKRMLVLLNKTDRIPPELSEIKPIYVPLPGREHMGKLVDSQLEAVANKAKTKNKSYFHNIPANKLPEFRDRVVSSLIGLTDQAAQDALLLSQVEHEGFSDVGTISTIEGLKAAAISLLPGLQYVPYSRIRSGSFLPGYGPVREVIQAARSLTPEYKKQHNLPNQRGFALFGPPGGGKTVSGMQIAGELGTGLLICSMGEVQGSLVSESERNMRRVINIAESGEYTLMLDDVDKGGMGAGNLQTDGGVFERLVNIVLTTMSDKNSRITWILTGNRLQNVRPELYRDGRVDEKYFVDLPDAEIRKNIVLYHLKAHNIEPPYFKGTKCDSAEASEIFLEALVSDGSANKRRMKDWSGAEIEGLIIKGIRHAGQRGEHFLNTDWLLSQVELKVAQAASAAAKDDIANMRRLASDFVRIGVSDAGKAVALSLPAEKRSNREADV